MRGTTPRRTISKRLANQKCLAPFTEKGSTSALFTSIVIFANIRWFILLVRFAFQLLLLNVWQFTIILFIATGQAEHAPSLWLEFLA